MVKNGFGKAKYDVGGFKKIKTFKLKTSETGGKMSYTFRILPPMKSCTTDGVWAKYYGTHWGYKIPGSKDPSESFSKPFQCVEKMNWETKMIMDECPECALIRIHRAKEDELELDLKKNPDNQITKDLLAAESEWLTSHNCARQWHINVMTPHGEFGTLQIANDVYKLLRSKIKDIANDPDSPIDPLDLDQGVWFKFDRIGAKPQPRTVIEVEEERIKDAQGRTVKFTKMAPLSEEQATQALEDCMDLNEAVPLLTKNQIKMLTECSGDPDEVAHIMGLSIKVTPASKSVEEPAEPAESEVAPASKPVEESEVAPTKPVEEEVMAEEEPVEPPPTPTPVNDMASKMRVMGMSEEMIAAAMGAQKKAEDPKPVSEAPTAPVPATPGHNANALGLSNKEKLYAAFKKKA
jgi:hypothetical protein